MEIVEVSHDVYSGVIARPYHVFNSANFNFLNANKCEKVFYWLFREGKYRLGIIVGLKSNTILSPFSAPFGCFSYLNTKIKVDHIEKAVDETVKKCREMKICSITLTLPPLFYDSSFVSKTINCLFRKNFFIKSVDLNYALDLNHFSDQYINNVWHNARKNLKTSLSKELEFIKCGDNHQKYLAYEVIKYNREKHGFPLRMTWEQILETISVIQADFFLVKNSMQQDIASAIVFHVKEREIAQVIYWGDKPEYSKDKTMNYMSFKVFEYYKHEGFKYVDIGPSTENSLPNYGLCEFKESIGCFISPKITMRYKV